ncbi:uncharacterized protein LOC126653468 [Mercurialis annua]|uniref:uncharacterized protein LOC126653468 n=1 Tax=Mercurialis annua TaxID=3986 RepID=UPI00215F8CE3|nr:uncharacterized protein LOC126653468 [Mercurialis annua]
MASDENLNMGTFDYYEHDSTDDGYYDHHPQQHNLSRLSVCTSSMYTNEDDLDYQDCDGMKMFMSRLSIESFDADEELSDHNNKEGIITMLDLSSGSDKEPGCYSLPATPPRRRIRSGGGGSGVGKEYASENEARGRSVKKGNFRRKRRVIRELDSEKSEKKKEEEGITAGTQGNYYGYSNSFSGESENGGVMVITRPKGGKRTLCMDLDEVKACRDLGFELEHSRVSVSGSNLDTNTSSGGNSPIANWRISSPGDDPRDVKARLKMWAQAVALASTASKF